MTFSLKTIALSLAALAAIVFVVLFAASVRWQRHSVAAAQRLTMGSLGPTGVFTAASLVELPAPVARYFRRVLREGQPLVQRAELMQAAEFLVAPGKWAPLRAMQQVTVRPPGFVWDARIRMAPLAPVHVRDAYVSGAGSMEAALLGLISITRQSGRPELDAGALQRYLGEAVWLPTALLPASGVIWTAVNEHAAIASLADDETIVSLEFQFSDTGEVTEIYTPARFREVDGRFEPTPWKVTCSDYEERAGMRIPVRCEVQWIPPSGPMSYWRGRIEQVRYEFGR